MTQARNALSPAVRAVLVGFVCAVLAGTGSAAIAQDRDHHDQRGHHPVRHHHHPPPPAYGYEAPTVVEAPPPVVYAPPAPPAAISLGLNFDIPIR